MKAICSNIFFVVNGQKACIKNITEPDLPENTQSGKDCATIVSCRFRTAPKSANLLSLPIQQILILASSVLFIRLRRALTLTVSLFTLDVSHFTLTRYLGFTFYACPPQGWVSRFTNKEIYQ